MRSGREAMYLAIFRLINSPRIRVFSSFLAHSYCLYLLILSSFIVSLIQSWHLKWAKEKVADITHFMSSIVFSCTTMKLSFQTTCTLVMPQSRGITMTIIMSQSKHSCMPVDFTELELLHKHRYSHHISNPKATRSSASHQLKIAQKVTFVVTCL